MKGIIRLGQFLVVWAWFGFGLLESNAQIIQEMTPAGGVATNSVSIESLVAESLQRNPELEFYRKEVAAAKADRKQAGAYQNPELGLEGGRKRSFEAGGGLAGEGTAWSVSLAQPLEFPGRVGLRKAIANRQIELAEMGMQQFKATLAFTVRAVAYRLYTAQALAEASENAAHRSQELVETLVQRDPAGINPLLEMRLIEACVISLNRNATDAMNHAKALSAELNQLRGAPLHADVKIVPGILKFPTLPPISELVEQAVTNNFEVRTQQIELAQQGLRVELSKKDRLKEVTVSPFYSEEKAGNRENIVGLGVSIPIPLWNRNNGNVQAAKARQEQAEVTLNVIQRRVERAVRERTASYLARLEQMSHWRPDTIQNLREASELADRHYRLGAVPVATYTELQEKYLEALEAILNTQAAALEDLQQIQLLTGDVAATTNLFSRR
ncbi:MAG: TolC family protein [Verrucomicrobiales bacterium]